MENRLYNEEELWELFTLYSFFVCVLTGDQKLILDQQNNIIRDFGPANIILEFKTIFDVNNIRRYFVNEVDIRFYDFHDDGKMEDTDEQAKKVSGNGKLKNLKLPNKILNADSFKLDVSKNLLLFLSELKFITTNANNEIVIINNYAEPKFNIEYNVVNLGDIINYYDDDDVLAPQIVNNVSPNMNMFNLLSLENQMRITNWLDIFNSITQNINIIKNIKTGNKENNRKIINDIMNKTLILLKKINKLSDIMGLYNTQNVNFDIVGSLKYHLTTIINNNNDIQTRNDAINYINDLINRGLYNELFTLLLSDTYNQNLINIINNLNVNDDFINSLNSILLVNDLIIIYVDGEYRLKNATEEEIKEEGKKIISRKNIKNVVNNINEIGNEKKEEIKEVIKETEKKKEIIEDEDERVYEFYKLTVFDYILENIMVKAGHNPIDFLSDPNPVYSGVPNPEYPGFFWSGDNYSTQEEVGTMTFWGLFVGIVKEIAIASFNVVKNIIAGEPNRPTNIGITVLNVASVYLFWSYFHDNLFNFSLSLIGTITANVGLYYTDPDVLLVSLLIFVSCFSLLSYVSKEMTQGGIPTIPIIPNKPDTIPSPSSSMIPTITAYPSPSISTVPTITVDPKLLSPEVSWYYDRFTDLGNKILYSGLLFGLSYVFYTSRTVATGVITSTLLYTGGSIMYQTVTGGDDKIINDVIDFTSDTITSGAEIIKIAKETIETTADILNTVNEQKIFTNLPGDIKEATKTITGGIKEIFDVFPPKYIIIFLAVATGIYYISTGIKLTKESIKGAIN
jgi:hypothetical protein